MISTLSFTTTYLKNSNKEPYKIGIYKRPSGNNDFLNLSELAFFDTNNALITIPINNLTAKLPVYGSNRADNIINGILSASAIDGQWYHSGSSDGTGFVEIRMESLGIIKKVVFYNRRGDTSRILNFELCMKDVADNVIDRISFTGADVQPFHITNNRFSLGMHTIGINLKPGFSEWLNFSQIVFYDYTGNYINLDSSLVTSTTVYPGSSITNVINSRFSYSDSMNLMYHSSTTIDAFYDIKVLELTRSISKIVLYNRKNDASRFGSFYLVMKDINGTTLSSVPLQNINIQIYRIINNQLSNPTPRVNLLIYLQFVSSDLNSTILANYGSLTTCTVYGGTSFDQHVATFPNTSGSYIRLPDYTFTINSSFTFLFYMKYNTTNGTLLSYQYSNSTTGALLITIQSDGSIRISGPDSDCISDITYNYGNNTWIHIGLVYIFTNIGSTVKYYFNGSLKRTYSTTTVVNTTLRNGYLNYSPSNILTGNMKAFRMYSKELTSDEINTCYNFDF